jgi:hypothetical protein
MAWMPAYLAVSNLRSMISIVLTKMFYYKNRLPTMPRSTASSTSIFALTETPLFTLFSDIVEISSPIADYF